MQLVPSNVLVLCFLECRKGERGCSSRGNVLHGQKSEEKPAAEMVLFCFVTGTLWNIRSVWLGLLSVWQMSRENVFDRMTTNVDREPTVWPDYLTFHTLLARSISTAAVVVQQGVVSKRSGSFSFLLSNFPSPSNNLKRICRFQDKQHCFKGRSGRARRAALSGIRKVRSFEFIYEDDIYLMPTLLAGVQNGLPEPLFRPPRT